MGKTLAFGTKGSGELTDLSDGKITTISEEDTNKKVSFVGEAGVATRPDGSAIAMTDGWSCFAFDMGGRAVIERFLVAGSGGDDKVYVDGGNYIGSGVNNCDVLYYEMYVGDTLADLFQADCLAYAFDNSASPQLAYVHTLEESVEGQYVGFRMTAGAWNLTRLSELGIYGSIKQTTPIGALSLTTANVSYLPMDNLLSTASIKQGELAWNDQPSLLTDGLIATLNTADGGNRCSFTTAETAITLPNGQPLVGYEGVADVIFKLDNEAMVSQFLVAGSGGDDEVYVDGSQYTGTGIDNRHVLYFEIYASETDDDLFSEGNRVWVQDNSTQKALTILVTLPEAVSARFVGFRVTGGAYNRARLSELGVYGDMAERPSLAVTSLNDEETMRSILGDRKNLLKGESVENVYVGYLSAQGKAEVSNEKMLTDGYIRWKADGAEAKKASYGNVNMDTTLYYDLRGTVDFDGILLANDGAEEETYRLRRMILYVGDDSERLFAAENCIGMAVLSQSAVCSYIDLSDLSVNGRYVGFDIVGDEQYRLVRLAELGVYGTYLSGPEPMPKNLLYGATPTETFQTDARGLDNQTAVDVEGNPGDGNTGTISNKRDIMALEPIENLTDGDIETRSAQQMDAPPDLDAGESRLSYQTPWLVYVYHLGGEAKVSGLELASSNEPDYQVSGVQYYASYAYADLFKNESLLYTSGGEHYVSTTNELTGETVYLPDATKDVGVNRYISYQMTDQQADTIVRFVAVVITRPYALNSIYPGSGMRPGYNRARASEFSVYGDLLSEEEPIESTYTATSSLGTVSMTIKPFNFDDRLFFEQTVGGITVTESRVPSTLKTSTDNYLLSVDGNVVYRVCLVDKQGNLIPDIGDDDLTALNGRDVEIHMPCVKDYVQTLGVVEGNAVRRLFNSYQRAGTDYINAGAINYPQYTANKPNNRHLATLQTTDVSLVYLKMNTPDEVKALSGDKGNPSLTDFATDAVAGATDVTKATTMYWLPVLCAVLAMVTVFVCRRLKKGGADR